MARYIHDAALRWLQKYNGLNFSFEISFWKDLRKNTNIPFADWTDNELEDALRNKNGVLGIVHGIGCIVTKDHKDYKTKHMTEYEIIKESLENGLGFPKEDIE